MKTGECITCEFNYSSYLKFVLTYKYVWKIDHVFLRKIYAIINKTLRALIFSFVLLHNHILFLCIQKYKL